MFLKSEEVNEVDGETVIKFQFGQVLVWNLILPQAPIIVVKRFWGSDQLSVLVGNVGVVFDSHMTFEGQVSSICIASFFHIRNISRIRKYLSMENTKILVHAFVTCRLDKGNALLYGLPKYLIGKLHAVVNCGACLILCKLNRNMTMQLLR